MEQADCTNMKSPGFCRTYLLQLLGIYHFVSEPGMTGPVGVDEPEVVVVAVGAGALTQVPMQY